MTASSPLWPARLHHLEIRSPRPEALAAFYRDVLGMRAEPVAGSWLLAGAERRLVIAEGEARSLGFAAYAVADRDSLERLRRHVGGRGTLLEPSPTALFAEDAFAVRDPDGNRFVFGTASEAAGAADPLPGRLQHLVFTSRDARALAGFHEDVLGFAVSDRVRDDGGDLTACFLRSDPEHHSLAVFRAAERRFDHHSYETSGWNDLRDWADRFASFRTEIWWGPGRHGPGNDLFFMVRDPDGNNLEFSAELERRERDAP
ncbi:MAG: VOC family protein, partial [Candidatus Binatia bacterium]